MTLNSSIRATTQDTSPNTGNKILCLDLVCTCHLPASSLGIHAPHRTFSIREIKKMPRPRSLRRITVNVCSGDATRRIQRRGTSQLRNVQVNGRQQPPNPPSHCSLPPPSHANCHGHVFFFFVTLPTIETQRTNLDENISPLNPFYPLETPGHKGRLPILLGSRNLRTGNTQPCKDEFRLYI